MNKLTAYALALILALTLAACGGTSPANNTSSSDETYNVTSQPGTETPDNSPDPSEEVPAEEDANLTGKSMLTLQDLKDWGYIKGLTFDEMRDKGLIKDSPSGLTLDEHRNDIIEHPEYYNDAVPFTDDPEVWIYTESWQIYAVHVYEGNTFLGPRGLAVGMTAEEVLNLFYCDSSVIMDFVKNPSQNTAPGFGEKIYIDAERSMEGSINVYNGQIESLNYGIWRNAFLNVYIENNRVIEFRVYFVYMDD